MTRKKVTMDNKIPPETVHGFVKVTTKFNTDEFLISERQLSVETISEKRLLNLWAKASHFEIHGEHKVYIQDLGFEILMPIEEGISFSQHQNRFYFPTATSAMINEWEKYFDSTFYQFEHLKIVNADIRILRAENAFKVIIKGFITDDIETCTDTRFFEAEFSTDLGDKIETAYNWNYSARNEKNYRHRAL